MNLARSVSGAVFTAVMFAGASGRAVAQEDGRYPIVGRITTGPRALALGGATAALREPEGLFGNPALAGAITSTSVTAARFGDGDAHAGSIAASATYGIIALSVGAAHLDYRASVAVSDVVPGSLSGGAFYSASTVGMVAAAMSVKGIRVGLGVKYAEERVEGGRESALLADVGAARDFTYGTIGLAVQNFGPTLRTGGETMEPATRVALSAFGQGLPLGPWVDFSGSAGVAVLAEGFIGASVGAELTWVPIEGLSFALRQGLRRPEIEEQRPFTAGLGLSLDRLVLDYAWEQFQDGSGHRLALRIR
ncbi:MAG: hypothetical protein ACT4OZ_08755 [Gemmatimonadota bacterium]